MKKWLVAIVCVLALCLAVCCCAAAEEDEINTFVTVTNGTLTDGVYTGSYYYRVNFSSMPDDTVIGMGFGAIGDDEPDENDVRIFPIGNLYGTPGHRYTFSFVDLSNPAWVDGDALFVRLDQREGWTKLAFRYDIDSTGAATTSVTNTVAPTLNNDNYTVTWNPVNGADGYFVHWQLANGADYSFFTPAGTTSMNMSDKALRDRYGEVLYELTKYPGDTQIWIETLKGGKSGAGTHKEFTIAGPANAENDTHLFLGCDREPETADGKTYYPMHVYEDVWFTVMVDEYARHNIREIYFVNGNSTEWLNAWEICNKGYGETKWVPEEWYGGNSSSKDYTVYAMAWVADNENEGHWIYSDPMNVKVLMDQTFPSGEITYSVPGMPESGPIEVPQDGALIVNVTNQAGVDYYGCFIEECGAESHWITVEAGGTTEVRMPMFRTEVGKTYQATVYGVKIGAPIRKMEETIAVKTIKKTGNQAIILQMKEQYETDERIRIYGYFENKQNISEDGAFIYLWVREKDTGKDVFKMEGDGFYLWEDNLRINTPGTYVAEAVILQDENMTYNAQPVDGTWTQVEFSVIGGSGTMSKPTVVLGTETAELGKAVSIAMSGSSCGQKAAERYVYRVFRDEDDQNDDEVLLESYANGAETLYIDTGKLGNGRYRVEVEATAQGYEPGYTTKNFTVRAKPTVTIISHYPDANGIYTIPVHHDFTLRINANGADDVVVDLDKGWDRQEIRLSDWDEWWNGQWGENHENIELTLQYDESCAGQGVNTFPVTVRSSYWFDRKDDAPIASDSLTVITTRADQVDTSGWEPVKYWKTDAGGDVFISYWQEDSSWTLVPSGGLTIARGNNLHIYLGTKDDERPAGWPEGCYECFSGFVMPAEQEGWNAYDANEPDESGWLRLNTAKFGRSDGENFVGRLVLYTWKDGWDSGDKVIPLTVTNTQVTDGNVYWVLSGADSQGNLSVTTHEGIYCSVYAPGADNVGLVMYNREGEEIWNENWGQDMVCMRDFAIDKANELTMKAIVQYTTDGQITENTYPYSGKITVTSVDVLPAPTVAMKSGSHTIQKGQNAEFVVTENPALFDANGEYKTEYANVHYNAFLWNENGDQIDQIWGIDLKSTDLSFNTDHLQAGHLYGIGVDIQQPEWDGADDKTQFTLISPIPEGQPTGKIQLSVDGSPAASISRPSSQAIQVQVTATEGATPTAVRVLNGDDWEFWYGKSSYAKEWYFGYDTTLVAMATYDELPDGFDEDGWDWDQWDWDRDVQWTVVSNTIDLKITSAGDLPKPSYQLKKKSGDDTWTVVSAENLSLVQGDELMIEYQIGSMQFPNGFDLQNDDYWGVVEIEQKKWDRWGAYWDGTDMNWEYDKNTASFLIPMYFYQPGDYRMRIGIDAIGWRDNADQIEFKVTQNDELPEARLTLGKASMMVGDDIEIMAYAPRANNLKVEIKWNGNEDWYDSRETGGDRGQWGWGCGCSGTYTFTLTAYFNGDRKVTDTQTLVVNRMELDDDEEAVLDRPVFSGIPSVIPVGSGLNGSFNAISEAENYHVMLEYCPDDGNNDIIVDENRNPSATEATVLTFSAEQLKRPGQYKVSVSADKYGYDNGYNEQRFTVLPGSNTSGKTVTLKVNGSVPESDPLVWPSSRQMKISVEAPDATAVRVLNGDKWEFWTSDDGFEGEWGFGDSVTLIALATYDKLPENDWEWQNWNWEDAHWTAISNVINVNVTNKGDMPAPNYQLQYKDGGEWKNVGENQTSFVRGTELKVVFGQVTLPEGFGSNENYWGFVNVDQQKGDHGNSWWDRTDYRWNWVNESRCIIIQTVVYEPGNYRMDVGLDAEGWRGHSTDFEFQITPTESLPQATMILDKTEMDVGDTVGIFAYAPGTDHMELEITWTQGGDWSDHRWSGGDYGDWNWNCGVHGDYTFTLTAYYRNGGEAQIEKTLKVNSSGAVGTMAIDTDIVNNQIWVGGSVNGSFTFTKSENALDPDRYTVRMEYRPDFGEGEEIYKENRNPETAGWTTLAFGSNLFSRAGEYCLQVSAEKNGYDHAYAEKHFVVLPQEESDGLTLKINGSTANVTNWPLWMPLEDVDVETTGLPQGTDVTAVRIWHGNYFEYFAGNRGYNDCDWGFDQGALTFIAQATTDEKVDQWLTRYGDLDQFDWNSVEWGYTSNAINVTVVSKGTLADPTVKIDGNEWTTSSIVTVERGNPLQFTLTQNDENTNLSGLRILKYRTGGGLEDGSVMDTEVEYTGTVPVSIPTDIMSAGSYQMRIDPRRYGYYGNERIYDFTVTETEDWQDQAKFTVSKTENVLTKEPVVFSINAPGAERVKLCSGSEDNVWCEEECDDMLVSVQMNWVRDYDVYAYALYRDQSDWTKIGEKIIHVIALENQKLNITNPSVPDSVKTSEDLEISLSCAFGDSLGYFGCWLTDVNGKDYEFVSVEENTDQDSGITTEQFSIPANTLQSGVYVLSAYAFPNVTGWEMGHYSKTITVLAGDEEVPTLQLQLSTQQAETGDDVGIMAYAKGATHMQVEVIFPNDVPEDEWTYKKFEVDGDTLQESAFMGEVACTVTVRLTATYDGGNTNTLENTIQVNAPKGKLQPAIRLNRAWTAGTGLDFSVDLGVNDAQYVVKVWEQGANEPMFFDFQRGVREKEYYIRANQFRQGKTYEIEVICAGSGYGRGETNQMLRCRKASPMTMVLPGSLRTIEAEAFEGVIAEKIIVPDGVTSIGYKAFANCPRLMEIELPAGINIDAHAFDGCGAIVLYGKGGSYLSEYAETCNELFFAEVQ